jgi:hypothetical protein
LNVHEQRRMIERQLKRSLGSDYVVVNSPDHPLLLRPPDLLVGGEGSLTAIMLGTAEEARSPDRAVARFTLSRAALPTETVFIFAVRPDQEVVAERLAKDVDEVVRWQGSAELANIAVQQRRSTKDRYSWEVKSSIMDRFGSVFRIAQHLRSIDRTKRGEGNFVTSHRRPKGRRARLRLSESQLLPIAEFQGEPGPTSIANLTLLGASRAYHLDDGVPYPDHGRVGSAFAPNVPEARGDPEKYLRASAFSGWVLVPYGTEYSPERIADLVDRRTTMR